jgi:predicted dithiol-disulfide oxidoreductase (DUF899 family)
MGQYHDLTVPNETSDYRAARDALLTEEIELRRQAEKVSSLRRALPLGGVLKEDYVFQNLSGEDVKLSDLFSGNSPNLLIYGFMYKPGGEPCPVCTSLLDGLNGSAPHIKQNLNFAVIGKAGIGELKAWADARNWSNLTLLSSGRTTYNFDYHAENEEEIQLMMMNVFRKTDAGIFHSLAYEIKHATRGDEQNPRQRDQIWPFWTIYDLTLDGRPGDWFPAYSYDQE